MRDLLCTDSFPNSHIYQSLPNPVLSILSLLLPSQIILKQISYTSSFHLKIFHYMPLKKKKMGSLKKNNKKKKPEKE